MAVTLSEYEWAVFPGAILGKEKKNKVFRMPHGGGHSEAPGPMRPSLVFEKAFPPHTLHHFANWICVVRSSEVMGDVSAQCDIFSSSWFDKKKNIVFLQSYYLHSCVISLFIFVLSVYL